MALTILDLVCCSRKRKLLVTNTPGVLTEDTADMVMGLVIGRVPRKVIEGENLIRSGYMGVVGAPLI